MNIIFFMCDDLGWGDLGCYGHSTIKTPNLDRFAEQGMLFTDCHSGSSVCSPSRAAMLTGRTPYRNGMYTIHVPKKHKYPYLRTSEVTLPSILRENGYATCHVGKWHLGCTDDDIRNPNCGEHGYDYWFATTNTNSPSHLNPDNFYRNGKALGEVKGYSAGIITDEAIEWISNIKEKDKPFFLTVWTNEPHTPIGTAPEFLEQYDESLPSKVREYYGNVTQIDTAFGKLIDFLDENGYGEDTLILFTSDNGPAWDPDCLDRVRESTGYHRGSKAWLYEGGIRVPGIIRWPGKTPEGVPAHSVINGTDYFPTVLDALNIPLPDDRVIDGVSVLPILEGKDENVQRDVPLYWRYDGADGYMKVTYREGDWVLLGDSVLDCCELYNLKEDWQQRKNLVYEEYDQFAEMKAKMVEIHQAVEEDGPDWWKDDPDPLSAWKQTNPIGITRHLLGQIPEEKSCPYFKKENRG